MTWWNGRTLDAMIPFMVRTGGTNGTIEPALSEIRNELAHGYLFDGLPQAGLLELVRDWIDYAYRESGQHDAQTPNICLLPVSYRACRWVSTGLRASARHVHCKCLRRCELEFGVVDWSNKGADRRHRQAQTYPVKMPNKVNDAE
jgi:hypothetical protein